VKPSVIGLITSDLPTDLGLADAALRQPGVVVQSLGVEEPPSEDIGGLILDVPLEQRPSMLASLAARWRVPILVESPLAGDLERARALESLGANETIVSVNPLRYALHTRRLLEEIAQTDDPLNTFFAAWRFRPASPVEHALPQLLDYLGALCPDQPCRISAMTYREPSILTLTLRYTSDVLGSIELGSHLPPSFPTASELVVECFCRESTYCCVPSNQSVSVYGRAYQTYDWQPDPADASVAAFAAWLGGGPRPVGGLANDLTAVRLADRIRQALQTGNVLELEAV
jgi:predicted dehydrogenase